MVVMIVIWRLIHGLCRIMFLTTYSNSSTSSSQRITAPEKRTAGIPRHKTNENRNGIWIAVKPRKKRYINTCGMEKG